MSVRTASIGAASPPPAAEPYEVVLRVAVKTTSRHEAAKLRREVDPLAVNGPAATGKWGTSAPGSRVRVCVGLNSCLVPRDEVSWAVTIHTADSAIAPAPPTEKTGRWSDAL